MRGNGAQLLAQHARSMIFSLFPHSLIFCSPSAATAGAAAMSAAATDANPKMISDQKRAIRSKIRRDLKACRPAQRIQEDIAIQSVVVESSWFKSASRLCAYISCEGLREVDTSRILSEVLKMPNADCNSQVKKTLYVPRVEDKNSNMRMFKISSMEDLVANSMNILEPSPVDANGNQLEDVMMADDPVDILLLPGVAFDRQGRRLGRGGGYYDVFLKKYQELAKERNWKQPLLIALSYSMQIMEEGIIPVTATDILVDALVSPYGVVPISPAAVEKM